MIAESLKDGLRAIEFSVVRNSQCLASGGTLLATGAGDLGFFVGVGVALKAGVLAYGGGRVATTLARDATVRDLAPAAVQQSQAFTAAGLEAGARTGLGQVGGSAATNTATASGGADVGLRDFVPGLAFGRALGAARRACGG